MALRLKWYEKRAKGKLHNGEHVVAGVHAHTSYLMMVIMPDMLDPLVGRHVVVTNERALLFGRGMKKLKGEWAIGQANAHRTRFHLTVGDTKLYVGGMIGPKKRIADEVVKAANGDLAPAKR